MMRTLSRGNEGFTLLHSVVLIAVLSLVMCAFDAAAAAAYRRIVRERAVFYADMSAEADEASPSALQSDSAGKSAYDAR